jgi:hypothetical protein
MGGNYYLLGQRLPLHSAKMLEQMPVGPHELCYPGLIDRINELPRNGSTQQCTAQPDQSMVVSRF